ncbi:MAG: insulinase family protein [Armatimonadetes bacterium]|nr:insulinase family protein [Armatimonadota bacterium]
MRTRSTFIHRVLITAMALQIFAPLTAHAQSLPAGVSRLASVEGITEYRLANGLRVLLFPDPSASTITVNVTYLVGSRHESYGETGMAHLLEHLLFKGSTNHKSITQELTEHGARANGTTWLDRTNYYETFPASVQNLAWALDMEADRMVNSFVAKKDLDTEMTVVRNEYEMGENNPGRVLWQRAMQTAFLWHNYGNPTIGARSDIEKVPIERLQAFYRKYYQPDNAILAVTGKFDEAKTLELVAKTFGPIPKPTRVLEVTYTEEPVQDGERSVTIRRVADEQGVLAVYHAAAGPHPDYAALEVLTQILGDTPAGRLHKALVETKKATGVSAGVFALREPGVVLVGADMRKDAPMEPVREGMIEIVEGVVKKPVTADEVERARTALLKDVDLTLSNSARVGIAISDWAAMGDWRLMFIYRDRLRTVKLEDVQRVAGQYLKPSNRTLAIFVPTAKPDRAEIPATPDVAALVKDYKGDKPIEQGEAFDASPANIEKRLTRVDLPGGLKLSLLPKKTRGKVVRVAMQLNFGDEKSLFGRSTDGDLAGEMLMRGTTKHTREQLKDAFDKLKASVSINGSASGAGVRVETTAENLPAVMELVAEVLRQPSFPAGEFEQLKQETLAEIEGQVSDPQAMASRAYRRHITPYPKGDVRYTPTFTEEMDAVKTETLDGVKKFHADFYGASNGDVAVVGEFDAKAFADQMQRLFGDWKSPKSYTRVPRVRMAVAPEQKAFETPDKANAVYVTGMTLDLRDDDPEYAALILGNYMLGGGFLNSRLATRIRQKEGLSYGVWSSVSASALDRFGEFSAGAIYAPQNVEKLQKAMREELARALKDGFTVEEVEAARNGWLQAAQVARGTDAQLAGTLRAYRFLGRTMAWDEQLEAKVKALTPQQITEAMRKHLDLAKLSVFRAGDFQKAGAGAK